MILANEESGGCFDIKVWLVHDGMVNHPMIRAYRFNESGVHFIDREGMRHFFPNVNVKRCEIVEHEEGGWKR